MSSDYVPPSTLDGIKRLATSIKREQGVWHHEALDLAAQRAGQQNFRHAQRLLSARAAAQHAVFLTAYWRTRERPIAWGRETLRVQLTKPLAELAERNELAAYKPTGAFRLEASDHLEHRLNLDSKASAQDALLAGACALRFMATTGLRPTTTRKQRALLDLDTMPERDHWSRWIDPSTGEIVGLDEPYRDRIELVAERQAWLAKHGLFMLAPAWEGMHNPGYTRPYLIVRDEAMGRRLQAQVEALGPMVEPHWESGAYTDRFVSPARAAAGRAASRRVMPAYPGTVRAGAVAYGGRPGVKGSWRPAVPMPFESHERVSRLLQNLSASSLPARVRAVILHARSVLEDWVLAEHREIADKRNDLYYGGRTTALDDGLRGAAMATVISVLRRGYQECAPRRRLLAKLERAEKSL